MNKKLKKHIIVNIAISAGSFVASRYSWQAGLALGIAGVIYNRTIVSNLFDKEIGELVSKREATLEQLRQKEREREAELEAAIREEEEFNAQMDERLSELERMMKGAA